MHKGFEFLLLLLPIILLTLNHTDMQPRLQHLRNLSRHSIVHRGGRMQRIVPKKLLQFEAALFLEIVLLARQFIFLAIVHCFFVHGCLGVGSRVVHYLIKEGVRVEVEDCGV